MLDVLGWVGLGPNFPTCSGLGWVGSGHTKWTHGQLWDAPTSPVRHRVLAAPCRSLAVYCCSSARLQCCGDGRDDDDGADVRIDSLMCRVARPPSPPAFCPRLYTPPPRAYTLRLRPTLGKLFTPAFVTACTRRGPSYSIASICC